MFLSKNQRLIMLAKKYGLRMGAKRFVAGTQIKEMVQSVRTLNEVGITVTVDYLGEFVRTQEEAEEMTIHSIKTIEAFIEHRLSAQLSVKLTSIGLDISDEVVEENLRRILEAAQKGDIDVNIDMEDDSRLERTIALYEK
ncbi:MAG: proline dehydrogenase family protein, partial [Bacilli bacterium]